MEKVINVKKDFSEYPFGRSANDGPNSGERFRNEMLLPVWNEYSKFIIDFSGFQSSPGSSFLSSAFIELITRCNKPYDDVKRKIDILPKDSVYPAAVEELFEQIKRKLNIQ